MSLRNSVGDIILTAAFDWREGIKSRRVVVWFIFYLLITGSACYIATRALSLAENQVAKMTGLPGTSKPGAMTHKVMGSELTFKMIRDLVGDEQLAKSLIKIPPMALFYAWFSFMFMPLSIVLLISDAITSDVSMGYVRFLIFRTSRFSYVAGKFLSSVFLLGLALLLSGGVAWLVSFFRLTHFEGIKTFIYIMLFSMKVLFYAIPFLGMTLTVSQIAGSNNVARMLGIFFYFLLYLPSVISRLPLDAFWSAFWMLLMTMTPQAHKLDFWRMDLSRNLYAALFSFGLGYSYLMCGYFFFSRKDL